MSTRKSAVQAKAEHEASWLLTWIGPRKTVCIGVVGVSLSLGLSGFCIQSFAGLVFLQGIAFGTFGSMIYLVSPVYTFVHSPETVYTIPSQFFLKRRGLSTGIASCGAGIGGAVWPLVRFTSLVQLVSWLSQLAQRLIAAWVLTWAFRGQAFATLLLGLVHHDYRKQQLTGSLQHFFYVLDTWRCTQSSPNLSLAREEHFPIFSLPSHPSGLLYRVVPVLHSSLRESVGRNQSPGADRQYIPQYGKHVEDTN